MQNKRNPKTFKTRALLPSSSTWILLEISREEKHRMAALTHFHKIFASRFKCVEHILHQMNMSST